MSNFIRTALVAAMVAAGLAWESAPVETVARFRNAADAAAPGTISTAYQRRKNQIMSPPMAIDGVDKPVRVLSGRFTQDVALTADTYWVLRGAVFVGEPARIIIEPGTWVIGETATRGTLVIERGAQIIADGRADAPIVMTSDQPVGERRRGDWGGLVINGRAPINLPGGVGIGEGDTGIYGGDNPDDSSGILRYLRVEFAGIEFSPDNELNGIAFQGVGRGTIVENIQVHFNKDDGIEMFGGTVDIKRVVLTAIGDDSIDWTHGWTGRLQFAIVQQRGDDTDQGIEADNNSSNHNLLPRSAPTIYNVTLLGDPTLDYGPESTNCMRLRVGTAAVVRNFICAGFKGSGIDARDAAALDLIASGALSTTHGIVFNNGGGDGHWGSSAQSKALRDAAGSLVTAENPGLGRIFTLDAPNWRPQPGAAALQRMPATPPADGFFEFANFIGALGPNVEEDWTSGWINLAQE